MTAKRWAYLGWIMFTLSGVFFLVDAVESADRTGLGAGITWLIGVVFFLFGMKDDSSPD